MPVLSAFLGGGQKTPYRPQFGVNTLRRYYAFPDAKPFLETYGHEVC